jgi:antitoxin (DNA-binding transcriptional repressor) of toxin-antitoxin stability system
MIEWMAQVHITEAELAADVYGMLDKVQHGVEIVVERNHRPVAIVRSPLPKGQMLSECIALAESRGSTATLNEGLMQDAL